MRESHRQPGFLAAMLHRLSGIALTIFLPLIKAGLAHIHFLTIHPFEDGNGRWARLLANIWLMQHDQPVTIWPATDLRETESPIRGEYIAAMKQADLRNYGPLIDLHKRFSE